MKVVYDPHKNISSNLIVDEYHDLTNEIGIRIVYPKAYDLDSVSPFYDDGLILKGSLTTNTTSNYSVLKYGTDYVYSPLFLTQTNITGYGVHSYLILLKPLKHLRWTYHAVGGDADNTLLGQISDAGSFDRLLLKNWLTFTGEESAVEVSDLDPEMVSKTMLETINDNLNMFLNTIPPNITLPSDITNVFQEQVQYLNDLLDLVANSGGGSSADPRVTALVQLSGMPAGSYTMGTGIAGVTGTTVREILHELDDLLLTVVNKNLVIRATDGLRGGGDLSNNISIPADFVTPTDLDPSSPSKRVMNPKSTKDLINTLLGTLGTAHSYTVGTGPNEVPTISMLL